jgi:hypothetical protein
MFNCLVFVIPREGDNFPKKKVKVNFTLEKALKALRCSTSIAVLSLNFRARWGPGGEDHTTLAALSPGKGTISQNLGG